MEKRDGIQWLACRYGGSALAFLQKAGSLSNSKMLLGETVGARLKTISQLYAVVLGAIAARMTAE